MIEPAVVRQPEPAPNPLADNEHAEWLEKVLSNEENLDQTFKFNASKELSNANDEASTAIPDTGLKKNLILEASPTRQNGHAVNGDGINRHSNINGDAYRLSPSGASSIRSLVTAEDGGDYGHGGATHGATANGSTADAARSTSDATHLEALARGGMPDSNHVGDTKSNQDGHPKEHSIPRGPRGASHDEDEGFSQQEGPTGRGPGQHEERIGAGTVTGQEGHAGQIADGEPKALMQTDVAPRKLDELGRDTIPLPGIHCEHPPGPQNVIELTPRVTHLQYHNITNDLGEASKQGLAVTPQGEREVPRPPRGVLVQTPDREVHTPINQVELDQEFAAHGLGRAPPGEGAWEDVDDAATRKGSDGHWRTAAGARVGQSSSQGQAQSSKKPKFKRFTSHTAVDVPSPTNAAGDASPRDGHVGTSRKLMNQFRRGGKHHHAKPAKVDVGAPSMTNEMLAGTLPVMILKTWLDRDDEGHRAVPVLLGNLRFRIGDSVSVRSGSRNTGKELYKIECEYGDGAIKWVVYRDVRDFLSLHAHYKTTNFSHRVMAATGTGSNVRNVDIPDFPRNALPYWARDTRTVLKEAGEELQREFDESEKRRQQQQGERSGPLQPRRQDSSPMIRDLLQQYLIDLIRAVMFRPESTRLCVFFELSALTVALAPRGGFQGKAGFLKLPSSQVSRRSNQPGLRPSKWVSHRSPKWFIVRESYFVAADGPAETDIYDVFLIDTDFTIERPKRAYRRGLHLLKHSHSCANVLCLTDSSRHTTEDQDDPEGELHDDGGSGRDKNASQHTFYISNAQRRLKLQAKNARLMHQFIVSMERVAMQCIWAGKNRFDSFAPIRVNVSAQWLVDGRDYFWNLSRAINMAKSRIYIHDWWISPEFYLRRPGDERYRLDNLLKRKAEEGVRIFIIIYNEVSAKATPVASAYVKSTLTGLHPNIMMQRSPSHLPNGTFYWSHHEKLCVIDETIAFHGGLDLCYGRWDTSQHILTDEDFTEPSGPNGPVWRGKDYANERVAEFTDLEKPFEDSIDRHKTPRMPWHDVGLSLVGQPARDLCRHFVQRWNYLLRIKNHTRKMPFLLPPADFTEAELKDLGLQGTCEVQICRSVGPWSMGTMSKIEHSVQNAYVKSIQLSEHFVYIENQFFITSTIVDGTPIENRIGDALVQRIIRAHKAGESWRACVVIPLLPGYTHPVDASEASSVRLILECQNRTICRGTHSIFSRLRKEGINPDDYISFFSLRAWAKFKSGALTTEQVYIHGKTMIVDDRLVLCGSANINERSQRGDRDSEVISVVRDTDMIDGTMAGKPFKVGRYAHTLRMRLMREHVGVDVDAIEEDELTLRQPLAKQDEVALWDPDNEQDERKMGRGMTRIKRSTATARLKNTVATAVRGITKGVGENIRNDAHRAAEKVKHPRIAAQGNLSDGGVEENEPGGGPTGDASERQDVGLDGLVIEGFASSVVPTLEERAIAARRPREQTCEQGRPLSDHEDDEGPDEARVSHSYEAAVNEPSRVEMFGEPAHAVEGDRELPRSHQDDVLEGDEDAVHARQTLRKHLNASSGTGSWGMPTPTPVIDPNRFHDPLDDRFWNDIWVAAAVHNTQIFRKVFRCVPDDMVTTWAQYKAFANHMDKFGRTERAPANQETGVGTKVTHDQGGDGGGTVGPVGTEANESGKAKDGSTQGRWGATSPPSNLAEAGGALRSAIGSVGGWDGKSGDTKSATSSPNLNTGGDKAGSSTAANAGGRGSTAAAVGAEGGGGGGKGKKGEAGDRQPSGDNDAWEAWEMEEMEALLNETRGHLVVYPTRFLEAEDMANNFLFNQERILPLLIYN